MIRKIFFSFLIYCSMKASAQVQVRNEPRHHNVFENEYVRLLDVHLAPKDTTQYHLHNTPSVFILFTKTNVGSQLAGKQSEKGINLAGIINYDSLTTPRLHRVWNEDSTWFHVMDVELTGGKPQSNPPPLQSPLLQLLFNEKLVTGYKVLLNAGKNLQLVAARTGYLLISLGDAKIELTVNRIVQRRIMKAGHYVWIQSGNSSLISSMNNIPAMFALLQLK